MVPAGKGHSGAGCTPHCWLLCLHNEASKPAPQCDPVILCMSLPGTGTGNTVQKSLTSTNSASLAAPPPTTSLDDETMQRGAKAGVAFEPLNQHVWN